MPIKPLLYLLHPALQLLPPLQHLTLPTRPRPNPTPPNPRIIIHLTLLTAQPLHLPLHTNLSFHLAPPERQTRPCIALDVARFLASAEIRIDDETFGVEFFQVDHASGDAAGGKGGGGKAHGLGLMDAGLLGMGEPGVELGKGAGRVEVGFFEGAFGVLFGLGVGFIVCGSDCWTLVSAAREE